MDPSNDPPQVLVHRAIPTDPSVRSSNSLFLTETAGQGKLDRRLVFCGRSRAPAAISAKMGVNVGEELIIRRRLMLVDGIPVRLAISYFPTGMPESDELAGDSFLKSGLQELFERHGRRFGRAEETLAARLPTAEEALSLRIQPSEPVVEILRISYDREGAAVHTLQTICAASRHVFVIRQPADDAVF